MSDYSHIMTTEHRSYFVALCKRVVQSEPVDFVPVAHHGWKPEAKFCHRNADHWASLKQGRRAVRGWIVDGSDGMGGYLFKAHSVVEEDGKLYDITPADRFPDDSPRQEPARLFLRHHGLTETFDAMLPACNYVPFFGVVE